MHRAFRFGYEEEGGKRSQPNQINVCLCNVFVVLDTKKIETQANLTSCKSVGAMCLLFLDTKKIETQANLISCMSVCAMYMLLWTGRS